MTKNEFMVRMHDVVVKELFLRKLYYDEMISPTPYQKVLFDLIAESDEIRNSYFSDENPDREVLSKEEINFVFGSGNNE